MEHHWISPHFRSDFFGQRYPNGLSLEDKITIFSDAVRGWQLDVADRVLRNDRHSGFAALSIVFSYFEMIERYRSGKWKYEHDSEERFKDGVASVFPHLANAEAILTPLWRAVRNGMYHRATTERGIVLDGEFKTAIALGGDGTTVEINPHFLVDELQKHFSRYVSELLDPDSSKNEQRTNFETVFDSWKKWGTASGGTALTR